jgi:nucleoid-associated protein YgaU
MSVSATRTLAAIGVLAAGIAGATLFRKEPGSQTTPVAERSWGTPGVQWQAAPYPDAISLPNSVANWPNGQPPPASLAQTDANPAAASHAAVASAEPSNSTAPAAHPAPGVPTSDALASTTATTAKTSPETTRLPASIGNPARPRDPLAATKEPPTLAPRYGDAQGLTGYESSTRRLPTVSASTHVIRDGDTLEDIARRHLGDAERWQEIYELNRQLLPDPDILPIGLELRLPPVGMVPVRRPQEQPRAVVDFASTRPE